MLYEITYMWNLKTYDKLVNTTKKRSRLTNTDNKLVITSVCVWGQYRGRRVGGTNYWL